MFHHGQVGDRVTAGDIYAIVPENTLMEHKVLVPPGARGNITWIAPQGDYTIADEVIEIEFAGQKKVHPYMRSPGSCRQTQLQRSLPAVCAMAARAAHRPMRWLGPHSSCCGGILAHSRVCVAEVSATAVFRQVVQLKLSRRLTRRCRGTP